MSTLPTFGIPGYVSPVLTGHLRQSDVYDIIFMHRNAKNNYDFGFAIGYCLDSTSLAVDEITISDEENREPGTGIFRITGSIDLLQNSSDALNQVSLHGGRLFEMHILYKDPNGTVESIPPKVGATNLVGLDAAVTARYPLAKSYLSQMGVKLRVVSNRGGKNLAPKLSVTGLTMGSGFWSLGVGYTPNQFYQNFPTLNRWTAPTGSAIS